MTIRVQCPNTDCGQVLNVRDEFAGKRGKCPACGSAMMIPTAAIAREILAGRLTPSPARERPRSDELPSPSTSGDSLPVIQTDDLRLPAAEQGEPLDFSNEPSPVAVREVRPAVESPAPVVGPSPVPSKGGLLAGYSMADLVARAALIVGTVALLIIGFVPQIRWLYVSGSATRLEARGLEIGVALGLTGAGVGTPLLVNSALLILLSMLCLVLLDLLPGVKTDAIIGALGGAAVGWGCLVFLWMLGFVWKAFTTASNLGERNLTILPGFGPLLGIFASLALIAVFGYLCYSRQRYFWLAGGAGLGLLFGLLLLIFNARPWQSWHI